MKRKTNKLLSLLLAAVLLLSLVAPTAQAAGDSNSIYLRTAEDLAEFSRNCTLDSWSQGKTVYLETNIDLTGTDFASIPTFGGTFEGQGHTISGLSLTSSGNVRGLFRYIQPTGAVRDLNVTGTISPHRPKKHPGRPGGGEPGHYHKLLVYRDSQRSGQHRRDRGHQRDPGAARQLLLLRLCLRGALCGRHCRAELRLHRPSVGTAATSTPQKWMLS